MLFSIITVTYNAEQVLPPTLKSVNEQSFRDFEYLVIDGASTDATLQLVNDAEALALIARYAKDSPDVIYGQTQLVDSNRQVVGMRHLTAPQHLDWKSFKDGMLVCHQAFIARRELCPHYDMRYRFSADFDWCIRVLRKSENNAYVGDAPIISFLSDGGLTTKNHKRSLRERYRIMCHYYGTVPTTIRHLRFALRHLMRKFK